MHERGIPTDAHVYTTVLSLCAEMKDIEAGIATWDQLRKVPLEVGFFLQLLLLLFVNWNY
jgi:pentatricopeptide repeat protein